MKKTLLIAAAAISLAFTACTTFQPVTAGSAQVGVKKGSASATTFLGLFNVGDDSMLAACESVGIKQIATVDRKVTNLAGIIVLKETIVTGE